MCVQHKESFGLPVRGWALYDVSELDSSVLSFCFPPWNWIVLGSMGERVNMARSLPLTERGDSSAALCQCVGGRPQNISSIDSLTSSGARPQGGDSQRFIGRTPRVEICGGLKVGIPDGLRI